MRYMSFGSKRAGSFKVRGGDSGGDTLFESDWDELVIRFDPESRSYRVMKASDDPPTDSADKEMLPEMAKVLAADV